MSNDRNWFAPKRYGYGPGVPISWQGWALMIAFLAFALALCLEFKNNPVQLVAALAIPTAIFVVVSCRTTRGGCRWRWGEEE